MARQVPYTTIQLSWALVDPRHYPALPDVTSRLQKSLSLMETVSVSVDKASSYGHA